MKGGKALDTALSLSHFSDVTPVGMSKANPTRMREARWFVQFVYLSVFFFIGTF